MTRRDLRAEREMLKLKSKINETGKTNFDEMSERPMDKGEMGESLI